jgi:uncharacterized delta-60 repeat protein
MKTCFVKFAVAAIAVAWACCHPNPLWAQITDPSFYAPQLHRPADVGLMKPAAKGKLYVAGSINTYGTTQVKRLVRLTPNGLLDSSFKPEIPDGKIVAFDVLPSGNVVVGILIDHNVFTKGVLYILAVDGRKLKVVENIWGYGINAIKALPDNRFLVAGDDNLVLFTKNFNIDSSFGPFYCDGPIGDIHIQGNQFVVQGAFYNLGKSTGPLTEKFYVARINMDGSVDPTFNDYGEDGGVNILTAQPDGKLIVSNLSGHPGKTVRLNVDQSIDNTFNITSIGSARFAHYSNGSITLNEGSKIVRVDESGTLDPSFTTINVNGTNSRLAVNADASVIVSNQYDLALYGMLKFNANGLPGDPYKAQLLRKGVINSMTMSGNSIIIGGDFVRVNDKITYHVAKLHSIGKVDPTFVVTENIGPVLQVGNHGNGNMLVTTGSKLIQLNRYGKRNAAFSFTAFGQLNDFKKFIIQDDRKVLVGAASNGMIYRLNADGTRDESFDIGTGPINNVDSYYTRDYNFDLDRNTGKIVYFGSFHSFSGTDKSAFVKLNPNGAVDLEFNQGVSKAFLPRLVRVLPGGDAIYDGGQLTFEGVTASARIMKVNAAGDMQAQFAAGLESHVEYGYTIMHPFRNLVLLGENRYYSDYLHQVIDLDGNESAELILPSNVKIVSLKDYFSRDDDNLFLYGNIIKDGVDQTIVKLKFEEPAIVVAAGQAESSDEIHSAISFYPNPVQESINVISADANASVKIYDLKGELKVNVYLKSNEDQINVANLPSGRYVIYIQANGKTLRQHLAKD